VVTVLKFVLATEIEAAIAALAIINWQKFQKSRFMHSAAALLQSMPDPVRAEVTTHRLEDPEHDRFGKGSNFLRGKFLDSFALVCVARKGAETDSVSAAWIEERRPTRGQ
jgi:hypothetical protein